MVSAAERRVTGGLRWMGFNVQHRPFRQRPSLLCSALLSQVTTNSNYPLLRAPRHLGPLPVEAHLQGRIVVSSVYVSPRGCSNTRASRLRIAFCCCSRRASLGLPGIAGVAPTRCPSGTCMRQHPWQFVPAGGRRPEERVATHRPVRVRFPEEHTTKIARAFADCAACWGTRRRGTFRFCWFDETVRTGGRVLDCIDRLDGVLFVPVARLTFDRLGWDENKGRSMRSGRFPDVGRVWRHASNGMIYYCICIIAAPSLTYDVRLSSSSEALLFDAGTG
ncbi:hypothetical protein EDB87DRAFT_344706 [Lactarius vividus]|nr:hypothetical protein EDB87DRAFT_344706 [Lactarius vividus]